MDYGNLARRGRRSNYVYATTWLARLKWLTCGNSGAGISLQCRLWDTEDTQAAEAGYTKTRLTCEMRCY